MEKKSFSLFFFLFFFSCARVATIMPPPYSWKMETIETHKQYRNKSIDCVVSGHIAIIGTDTLKMNNGVKCYCKEKIYFDRKGTGTIYF